MTTLKPSEKTRQLILDAALVEFIEHGREGMRLEHVAERSGRNKALIYKLFKDKDNLINTALTQQFETRRAVLDILPLNLSQALKVWFIKTTQNPDFMRMILREALDLKDNDVLAPQLRRNYYADQIRLLKLMQDKGEIALDYDIDMLFLALLSITTLASSLPQIVNLATNLNSDDPIFQERFINMLQRLAKSLKT